MLTEDIKNQLPHIQLRLIKEFSYNMMNKMKEWEKNKPMECEKPVVNYIVAGNYKEFCDWCIKNKVSTDSPLVRYLGEYGSYLIQDIENPNVLYYGTFYNRPDIKEVYQNVDARTRTSKKIYHVSPSKHPPYTYKSMEEVESNMRDLLKITPHESYTVFEVSDQIKIASASPITIQWKESKI